MKKLAPILTILVIIAAIMIVFLSLSKKEQMISVYKNNPTQKPLKLDLHHLQDPQCAMVVETDTYAAQVAAKSGNTWVFDDVGCMALWLENKTFKEMPKLWVYTLDTKQWIEAQQAYYSVDEITPMRHGFGAHEKEAKGYISYEDARLRTLRGEDMTNPRIRKKLLGR